VRSPSATSPTPGPASEHRPGTPHRPSRGGTGRTPKTCWRRSSGAGGWPSPAGEGERGCTTSPSGSSLPTWWNAPTPTVEDAQRSLVHLAARALGIATVGDLADYFRLGVAETRARVRELTEDGGLLSVRVEGWKEQAYLHPDAKAVRIARRTLLSPFDSLIWDRKRTERLFGFRYRIEIYVPEAKRQHGYYVLPFLSGDSIAGRADLKADRQRECLVVPAAFVEPPHDARRTAADLAEALGIMAAWLELDRIEVGDRGDLVRHLERAIRSRGRRLGRPRA
jgi:uncharacterized protein YcaQ